MAGGSVTDPEKRYHLELTTTHQKVARETDALLLELGYGAKLTSRGGNCVLYFKQSELIEDFLTMLGAPVCALDVMQAKMEKDLRNGVNRRVNCETANLVKAADASARQIAAIKSVLREGGEEAFPDNLRETVRLRLSYPTDSLTELARRFDPPISKPGLSHRLKKITEFAAKEN